MLDSKVSLALLSLATTTFAADRPTFAIVEKVAGRVSFYSTAGERISEVKVGDFPHEAVLSRDGRTMYVSDNGVLWMTEDKLGTNTISIIDTVERNRIGVIDLGRFHRPHGLALDPGSDHLYATTERPYRLVQIDTKIRKVVRDYDVKGKSPHMVMLGPAKDWAFVSDTDSDTVAAIELATGRTEVLKTGEHPQGGVLSPNGKRLYVVNANSNTISVIDPLTRTITGSIRTGKGPGRIAITPDGNMLVYNLQFDAAVGFADVASGKQMMALPIGGRSLSLTMTRDGRRAFAGIQDQDKVLVISVPERRVIHTIQLPKNSGPDPVIPLQ